MCLGAGRPSAGSALVVAVVAALAMSTRAHAQAKPGGSNPGSPQEGERGQLLRDLGLRKRTAPPSPTPRNGAPPEAERPAADASTTSDTPSSEASNRKASTAPAASSFRRVVHPLLMQTCTPCHAAGGQGAATRLVLSGDAAADHAVVSHLVDLRAPAASPLLVKPSGAIHAGGAPWPTGGVAYERVVAWIQRGARLDGSIAATAAAPVPEASSVLKPAPGVHPPNAVGVPVDAPAPLAERGSEGAPMTEHGAAPATAGAPVVGFADTVHPLLMSACASCHGPKGPAAMSRLVLSGDVAVDEPIVERQIDLVTPRQSPLLTKASGQLHGGGLVISLGDARSKVLGTWIDDVVKRRATLPDAGPVAGSTVAAATDGGSSSAAASPPPATVPQPRATPALPFGLALNGRFDVVYERRQFSGDPFASTAVDALRSYHHFLFLTRASLDDPFGLSLELLSLQFWEVHARLGGSERGYTWQLFLSAGKLLVPFGADPLTHQSYGGLSGFDQRILPAIWAQEGAAAHLTMQRGELAVTDDLFVVRGYAIRDAAGILSLQNDFSAADDARLGWGNRVGASWMNLSGWYSAYYNPLGFGRRLFMQAVDVMLWRPRHVPVLGHFSAGAGALRADVSGGDATGVGGPGKDYYHFGSYLQLRYHPTDWLYLQYRQGLRTFNNRRGVVIDDTRLTGQDGSTHNFGLVARCRGLSLGLFYFINLEKVDEVPDDLFRVSVTYDF